MTKEELLEFLKENLKISVSVDTYLGTGYNSDEKYVKVTVGLSLDGEEIHSEFDSCSV